MHMPDELDSRIREVVWRLVETSPPPPPFPSPVDARDERARTLARPARVLLSRLRPRTSRGLMGVIVIAVAIVALFVVPIPQLHLFGHRSGHHPLPKVPAVGTRLAELKGSDTTPGDYFGSSLAISGGTLVVGVFDQANNAGRAYVFKTTAVGWKQVAELKGSDTVAGDNFGSSVAISGRTIVVGSSSHAQSPGSAYVFAQTASGWTTGRRAQEPPSQGRSWLAHLGGDLGRHHRRWLDLHRPLQCDGILGVIARSGIRVHQDRDRLAATAVAERLGLGRVRRLWMLSGHLG